jgi:ElaB/YqjD/DUF883 family membrane-anchored ribosome-binding protein
VKIKLLAIAVAGILLSGCNDDNGQPTGVPIQAFDPAVQNMAAAVTCADGTTETSKTDYSGNANFFKSTPIVSPETCTFTFTGGNGAQDVSNGKLIGSDVVYIIPAGMAKAGSSITASPLTTLIARELAATGAEYSESIATDVLTSLGLDALTNNNSVSVTELLSNTEAVLDKLSKTTDKSGYQLLAATTASLTEVLRQSTDSVSEIAAATKAFAVETKDQYVVGNAPVVVTISPASITAVIADPTEAVNNPPVVTPSKKVPKPEVGTGTGSGSGSIGNNV